MEVAVDRSRGTTRSGRGVGVVIEEGKGIKVGGAAGIGRRVRV